MEQRFTMAEQFGQQGGGDGFRSITGIGVGGPTFTACVAMRLSSGWLPDSNLGFGNQWVAGNFDDAGGAKGWRVYLSADLVVGYSIVAQTATSGTGYFIWDSAPRPSNRLLIIHIIADGDDQYFYFNGELAIMLSNGPQTANFGERLYVGARDDGAMEPMGTSEWYPGTYNGVGGVAYGDFAMTETEVYAHWKQILQEQDLVDGLDDNGDTLAWDNLWSARRGFNTRDGQGVQTLQTWEPSIGANTLERFQVPGQDPTVQLAAREGRFF